MSLNSYSTPDGLEIGRAQAVQAEACGITPESDMNPVLLKPTNEQCSQVVLNGKPVGNMSAREYFMSNNKAELFNQAYAAYERLQVRYSPIVLEGAGSISEINLRERDITNMRMALRTNAATYLVADIDRGGVFASVYGSITLLSEEERKLIKGIIINKFRGDISLFFRGEKDHPRSHGYTCCRRDSLFQRHLYRRRRLRLTGDQKHQSRERQDQRGHRTPETPFQFHGLQRVGTR